MRVTFSHYPSPSICPASRLSNHPFGLLSMVFPSPSHPPSVLPSLTSRLDSRRISLTISFSPHLRISAVSFPIPPNPLMPSDAHGVAYEDVRPPPTRRVVGSPSFSGFSSEQIEWILRESNKPPSKEKPQSPLPRLHLAAVPSSATDCPPPPKLSPPPPPTDPRLAFGDFVLFAVAHTLAIAQDAIELYCGKLGAPMNSSRSCARCGMGGVARGRYGPRIASRERYEIIPVVRRE